VLKAERVALVLNQYRMFQEKVSAHFDHIFARHQGAMKCGQGCHECCAPGLSVFGIEATVIRDFLLKPENAERVRELALLERRDPFLGGRCSFLKEDGRCGIYEVRPIVCRSHGAPLTWPTQQTDGPQVEDEMAIDVCRLNFTGVGGTTELESVPDEETFRLDTLNTVLSGLQKQWSFEAEQSPTQRIPLQLAPILERVLK
jgi:uncharacterized protein